MALSRITLLLLFAVAVRVQSQFDSNGFLSIDCGAPAGTTYIDKATGLTYISDDQFIDTGNSSKISPSVSNNLPREYFNVRYFLNGVRNCFTIRSLKLGTKYLARATFIYGNYDNLNNPPMFDLYLGVNFWYTVDTSQIYYYEIMINANNEYLEVCLVNSYKSVPFISSIHLRQLQGRHPYVNSTQSLVLDFRANVGASNRPLVRYPDDINDRWWWNYTYSGWKEISSSSTITIDPDSDFKTPSLVLQTGCTTSTPKEPLNLSWESKDISTVYYFILHFYEIQIPLTTGRREFNILINGIQVFNAPTVPGIIDWLFTVHSWTGFGKYNVSLVATPNSTLPPLLNAFELFIVMPVGIPTFSKDGNLFQSSKLIIDP